MIFDAFLGIASAALDVVETAAGVNVDDFKFGSGIKRANNSNYMPIKSRKEDLTESLEFWKNQLEFCKSHDMSTGHVESVIMRLKKSLEECND